MNTEKIKAIIVDDESHARELLREVLTLFDNPIKVVGEVNNLPEAIQCIQEKKPKVVFMDIDMPQLSGLELNRFLPKDHNLLVVYVTAHSEYTIEALRESAFDYLLKPINLASLKNCIARVQTAILKSEAKEKQVLFNPIVEVSTHQTTKYVPASEILYIQASSMYAVIQTETEQLVVSKPLKAFIYLEEAGFYRVHRSYLVNTKKIKSLSTAYNEVTLINKSIIPISRAEKEGFKAFMRRNSMI